MNTHNVAALGLMSLVTGVACADASYEQTSQITGGALTDTIKSISFLGSTTKEMLAPTNSLTLVHGNQKAVINKNSTEIVDLDKETITRIDTAKKTYTVMTFAQMRQAAADMMKRIQQAPPQQAAAGQQPTSNLKTSFEVSVKNTGQSKSVNGLDAQEQVVEMQMHVTNPNGAGTEAQNTMTYTVTTDAWIAPDPPEVKEIQDFDARMGKKMMEGVDLSAFKPGGTNPGLAQMFSSKPGTAEAMAQMQKEMAKLKGTRVMEVTRMGGDAPGTATGQQQSAGSGSSVVGDASQAAGSAATSSAAGATGSAAGSAAANAAGNSIGGSVLGSAASAFSSKLVSGMFQKKPAAATSPANTTTTTAAGTQATTRVVLMEMTMQKSNFSQEAIPPSAFAVPGGFKQIPSAYDQMSK
ncbi:MAG: hypothetical protein ACHQDB_02050 [Steroidobacterales bacterium]